MLKEQWRSIDSTGVIRAAEYRFPGGSSRSLLIPLADRSFLAYSPGAPLLDSAMQALGSDSEVVLLAPSAAHSLGLEKWKAGFRNSRAVAADAVVPRLLKKTSLQGFESPDFLRTRLPANMGVHVPPACSFGEVWLSIDTDGRVYWAVCDAFFNLAALSQNVLIPCHGEIYDRPDLTEGVVELLRKRF